MVEEPVVQAPAESSGDGKHTEDQPVEELHYAQRSITVIQDPRLLPVDKSVPMAAFSSYMYPDRRRQLKQEATSTGDSMQDIIDVALSEYFEQRYGKHET